MLNRDLSNSEGVGSGSGFGLVSDGDHNILLRVISHYCSPNKDAIANKQQKSLASQVFCER